MSTFNILVPVVAGAIAISGAEALARSHVKHEAALGTAMCAIGTVGLVLLAVLGPDDQRTWRLLAIAATLAVGAVTLADVEWVHELLAAGAGMIVVDRLRRMIEPVFTPAGWAHPTEAGTVLGWTGALIAATLLVVALRSAQPGMGLAVAAIWALVVWGFYIVAAMLAVLLGFVYGFPLAVVVVLLTVLPLGVALDPWRWRSLFA